VTEHPIVFFDGVCNLCAGSVQFLLRHDRKGIFHFCSLQSKAANQLLNSQDADPLQLKTLALLEKERLYTRSTAVLRIARKLGGAWPLLYAGMIIPRFIRDSLYDWVAANRYRWFGKKESCWLPQPEWSERFIK
jgi:predicted DCC family thiol-disulfide oxidoreductase YuxK